MSVTSYQTALPCNFQRTAPLCDRGPGANGVNLRLALTVRHTEFRGAYRADQGITPGLNLGDKDVSVKEQTDATTPGYDSGSPSKLGRNAEPLHQVGHRISLDVIQNQPREARDNHGLHREDHQFEQQNSNQFHTTNSLTSPAPRQHL